MILFVDHQADLFIAGDGHAAGTFALGMFPADQLSLDQELSVDDLQVVDVDVLELARFLHFEHAIAEDVLDLGAVLLRGTTDEGEFGQVARQADAAGNDDIAFGTAASKPLAARLH
jgi:hypothetical protein